MFGNFEKALQFRSDGRWLEVCGDVFWDDPRGPEPADRIDISVTVTQTEGETVVAQGSASFVKDPTAPVIEIEVNGNKIEVVKAEWMFFVQPPQGGKFVQAQASAVAVATITHPATLATVPWIENVTLEPNK